MSTEGGAPTTLAFTVVDEAVHLLDRPADPWSIEMELQVSGRLDEDRFREALGEAMRRHAMARARRLVPRRSDREYRWEITPTPDIDPLQVVECPDDAALDPVRDELQSRAVPLVESPPLRIVLAHCPGGDVVMVNVNHAAFDGFGTLRFLTSVARAYTGEDDPPPPVQLDQARDVRAHLLPADTRTRLARVGTLGSKLKDLVDAPARLAPAGGEDRPGYRLAHRALAEDQTSALSRIDHGATVNDVLLAALHRAVEGWNADHGRRTGRVSVLVPVNLRPKEWRKDVVTNFVLETRVSTRPRQRADGRELLDAIAGQTERVKRYGTGAALIELLGRFPYLPVSAKEWLSPLLSATGNRLVDTAVLTNLAEVDEPPSFGSEAGETTSMWFSAPARMPCGLSVGALSLNRRLHLSFRFRHPLVGRVEAGRFAERYVDELDRLVKEVGVAEDA